MKSDQKNEKAINLLWSEAELKLVKALSFHWFKLITESESDFNQPAVYRILVELVFNNDMKGPAVEALRRCNRALHACKPYRMTPEFDKLAEFDERLVYNV